MSTEGPDPNGRNIGGDTETEPAGLKWWLGLSLATVVAGCGFLGAGLTRLLDLPENHAPVGVSPTILLVLAIISAEVRTLRHVVAVAAVAAALGTFVTVACATAVSLSQSTIVYIVVVGTSSVVAWLAIKPAYKRLGVPMRSQYLP